MSAMRLEVIDLWVRNRDRVSQRERHRNQRRRKICSLGPMRVNKIRIHSVHDSKQDLQSYNYKTDSGRGVEKVRVTRS